MNIEAQAKDTLNLENPIVENYRGFYNSKILEDFHNSCRILKVFQGSCQDLHESSRIMQRFFKEISLD